MFTPEGLTRVWEILAGQSADSLASAQLRVSDGQQATTIPLDDGFPQLFGAVVLEDGSTAIRLIVQATFDEDEANFEWAIRDVLTADGVVLDTEPQDLGRKAAGSVWTLEAALDLKTQS